MNEIVGIEQNLPAGERTSKFYEIILPDSDGTISFSKSERTYCAGDVIVVAPSCAYRLSSVFATHVYIKRALLGIKDVTVFRDDKNCGVRNAVVQAENYLNRSEKTGAEVVAALGNLLISYVTFNAGDCSSPVIETVRDDVENNLSNVTYSLEDSLKKLPLNYDYVRKLFKKQTGVTPHEYLVSRRMELARGLITSGLSNRYSAYSVSQIAEACGFAEPLYFSRVFKKYYGVAPSEYGK